MKNNRDNFDLFAKGIIAGIFLLTSLVIEGGNVRTTDAQIRQGGDTAMQKRNDAELIDALGSRNGEESFLAAKEIFVRGDKMISLLVANKGNQQPFAGGGLGNPNSGAITFVTSDKPEWDEGRIVTVEVASIYLISALYYKDFEFASSAYLMDREDVRFNKYNTTERVARAWHSVEKWLRKMKADGILALRQKKCDPLAEARMHF